MQKIIKKFRLKTVSLVMLGAILLISFSLLGSGCALFEADRGVEAERLTTPLTTESDITGEPASEDTAEQKGSSTTNTSDIPQVPMMVKIGNVRIEVEKGQFEKKFEEAQSVAKEFEGYVTESSTTRKKGELSSGTVTIRIPSDKFDQALKRVKEIGKVQSAEVKSEDVGEEYVDLESRLKNYKAQEDALILLMAKAESVEDTLAVQQQLVNVQEQIELITGRLNYLTNRVDHSTITVTILEPGAVVPSSDDWGFVTALRTAARAFLFTINSLIVIVGALLPIVFLIVIFIYVARFFFRRRVG